MKPNSLPVNAQWLSLPEYARLYGVHYNTAVKWMHAGLLVTYKVKNLTRVRNQPPREPAHRECTS